MVWLFLILFFIVIFCICYFSGLAKGKKQAEIKQVEESLNKAEETIRFNRQKEEIKQEVFSEAKARKAELDVVSETGGDDDTGRDRFNRISAVLSSKSQDQKNEKQSEIKQIEEIKQEVLNVISTEKSGDDTGRDRFNRINDVLRRKPESRN
jgi:biopolymer transport protein ExbB/TolQ